ncbi:MAG: rhodanese-related sulfurtransferase [Flavobacteriales bacterium]|nr:rhodanese-related sulfurtransferase [Flavobacteriales bacterium]|tara:strand:+ start:777 stop:1829 length:1053 start_codon:yes stop_codon:yes gene_type:complete
MDPNAGKKNMFNKLSKSQCMDLLKQENFNRVTVSFYRYIILSNLNDLRDNLYNNWNELGVLGRIYIANEGINAQLSVPEPNWGNFVKNINSYNFLEDIPFKIAVEDDGKSFFKLTIKIKNQIVSDGLKIEDYDVTNVGEHLSAKQWNEAINKGAIVVDIRNHYESEIGKFKGAICPEVETFKEELPVVRDLLKGKEKEDVLLYCTGGIRCEKTSAYLKHHGFKNVSQLHGGIIDYVRQLDKDKSLENKFEGKNFVFDERRGERISDNIISTCHQCDNPCDTHVNCKNENCNLLFLQCLSCQEKHKNCCSVECIEVINLSKEERLKLRKGIENKKMYHSHSKVTLNLKALK